MTIVRISSFFFFPIFNNIYKIIKPDPEPAELPTINRIKVIRVNTFRAMSSETLLTAPGPSFPFSTEIYSSSQCRCGQVLCVSSYFYNIVTKGLDRTNMDQVERGQLRTVTVRRAHFALT